MAAVEGQEEEEEALQAPHLPQWQEGTTPWTREPAERPTTEQCAVRRTMLPPRMPMAQPGGWMRAPMAGLAPLQQ